MEQSVTHLIVGLAKGGAETMLYQILKFRTNQALTHRVISLGASHYYEEAIRDLGTTVEIVPLKKNPMSSLFRIFCALRKTDTLCCWMYHANFLGYVLGKLARVPKIIWCIRHSNLDPMLNKKRTLQINSFCAKKSRWVDVIAYNGIQARIAHEAMGYCHKKAIVLDNGCDCDEYVNIPDAKARIQTELQLPSNKKIILSITKYSLIKDIPTFIKAFGALHRNNSDTVAILCGTDVEQTNEALVSLCLQESLKVGTDIFLLGMRHDVPELLSACNLYVLHSLGEAFPNVLIQAMSCECLCLTTDAGDSRRILGQDHFVVPPGDAVTLCASMENMLALPEENSRAIGKQNRDYVLAAFSIREIVKRYEEIFAYE